MVVTGLVRRGWYYRHGKKHGKLVHPNGKFFLTIPKTPGDWRAARNFQRDIRNIQGQEEVI